MPVIGLIAVTGGGRGAAERLAAAWPGQTRMYDGPARQALARAWAQCDGLVCFLAVGATVRLIAPLLNSKWTDPAVVCVDESGRRAVAVVGGHAAGANALATRVAEVFGADAVITTATDAVSLPGLDTLGWPTEGAIGTVSRALLDGEQVQLESAETWPLPPLPATVGETGEYRILITDRVVASDPRTAVLRPPSLVVGVHLTGVTASYEAGADEVLRLADAALGEAGLSAASVSTLAALREDEDARPGLALPPTASRQEVELLGPGHRRSTVVHAELGVDALGVTPHRAQRHHELTGDLRSGQIGCKQPQHVKLTVAQRLDERLLVPGVVLGADSGRQKAANVVRGDSPVRGVLQQGRHGWALIEEDANIAFRFAERQGTSEGGKSGRHVASHLVGKRQQDKDFDDVARPLTILRCSQEATQ